MRIGFLGLGQMGMPLACNLLGRGHAVTVYNRTPGRARALLALGATESPTVEGAVKHAEVAITMLPDDAAVMTVAQGPEGLLQHLPPKAIHLCMGTIGVETSTSLASDHAKANQGYLAAPVFGKASAAASRHLWIVVGGPEPQVKRCVPIFEALAMGYSRVGPMAPLANAIKLGGNVINLAMELAISEILGYAKQCGMPPADYFRLLNTAIFRSHMADAYGEGPVRASFDPAELSVDLAANELLLQSAADAGVPIAVADLLRGRLQAAKARGWGEPDLEALAEACREETGLSQPPPPEPTLLQDIRFEAPAEVVVPVPEPMAPPGPEPSPSEERAPSLEAIHLEAPPIVRPPSRQAAHHHVHPLLAQDGGISITLDLNQCSHFEWIDGRVWAWSEGRRYQTAWNSLEEVELTFNQVLFLRIKRQLLLRPEAVQDFRPTFGGGARATVAGAIELSLGRAAHARLKDLLGV